MKKIFLTFIAIFLGLVVFCQTKFDIEKLLKQKPVPQKLVNDFAGILTSEQAYTLEQKLIQLDDNTSTQIAVVIVPALGGNDISDFNVKLLRAWGVGGKKNNNGVVVLISTEEKNRKINIATGYGVEGALPDVLCKRIIDDEFIPSFKGNDYYRGINQGTDAIVKAVQGEYNVKRDRNSGGGGGGSFIFIFLLIIIFFILSSRGGKGGGGSFMSRRGQTGIGDAIFWNVLLNSGGGGGGGWSGGGGDSGGGGFGGFGGGSGGGGGASGSW
jgi:uncharacterized protein